MKKRQPSHKKGKNPPRRSGSGRRAASEVPHEAKFLKDLVEKQISVTIRLQDNQEVTGVIESYDEGLIRLNRSQEPNLSIYKEDIKYFRESAELTTQPS